MKKSKLLALLLALVMLLSLAACGGTGDEKSLLPAWRDTRVSEPAGWLA